MPLTIDALNQQFAIADHLYFEAGPNGIPIAHIENEHAAARVALLGGTVLHYQPHGEEPVLWLSETARFEEGSAIRGGVPVCWPWFGDHPSDPDKPSHGVVRQALWQVDQTRTDQGGETVIVLSTQSDKRSKKLWACDFRLRLSVTVGSELSLDLTTENIGDQEFVYAAALHSYFAVTNAKEVSVEGLDGCEYLDKTENFTRKRQKGPVVFSGEVDRVFLNTESECTVRDPGHERGVCVAKDASRTTVVWNPGAEKVRAYSDILPDAYTQFVCVETAKAINDVVTVEPGTQHRFGLTMWVNG